MTEAATTPDSGRPAEKVSEVLRRKSRSMLVLVVVIALLGFVGSVTAARLAGKRHGAS